jgi:N-acetylglucosaminyl-diphospho-decaprenol L-rhamnosyltransferase
MRTKLAIIILNYRTPDLTIGCVDSLRGEIAPGIVVVVVDNASGDGSADRIQEHISKSGYDGWAQVVRSPVNGGFASGNNLGIRSVQADAYVLLNSDTVVRPGAIAELGRALEQHPKAGMIGPSFEGPNGETEQSCFRFPHPVSEFLRAANTGSLAKVLRRYDVPLPFSDVPLEPDWIAFACVVIRREVIDQVGLLDEDFFMYFEDVAYCHKVRAAGWTILYWPRPRIMHFMGGSSQISSSDESRRRPARYFYEARTRFFATHFGVAGLLAANALWTVGRAISFSRELVERKPTKARHGEILDIWINVLDPMRPSTAAPGSAAARAGESAENGAARVNANPTGLGLTDLLREDFATHNRDLLSPGFWAVAVHRFGNWRLGVRPRLARAPLTVAHKAMFTAVDWLWGIELGVDVKVGRRVCLSHHGSMILNARAIGDDVHVRQNTTFGDPGRDAAGRRPVIEDRVDVGVGVSILGDVVIGHDTVVGPNAVVLASCPPHSKLDGVPARISQKTAEASVAQATP